MLLQDIDLKYRRLLIPSRPLFVKRRGSMKKNFQMSYMRSGIDCTA